MKYLFFSLICLYSSVCFSQVSGATILGTALDDSGESIPFANVSLNDSIGTQTDMDGKFKFDHIDKGTYTVRVDYVGYPSEEVEVVVKKIDKVYKITIEMSPGAVLLKPAIYLYSKKRIDVTLDLSHTDGLIFTHPKYEQNWVVSVEGDQITHKDQTYDYLFWEADESNRSQTNFDQSQGFCIAGNEAINFLEKSAANLGFNDRETTDFVSFWGPRIVDIPFAHIYFKVDDAYNEVMPIEVTPIPDVSRRVFMLVKPLNEPIHLTEQELTPINRHGFVLIEWGGSLLRSEAGI